MSNPSTRPTDAPIAARASDNPDDPLRSLHKMSTTAGLGATEYVAINSVAVASLFLGLASALALLENTLLLIPAVAVVCAGVALWQIRSAGGTQGGRGFAVLGLLLALVIGGVVVYRQATAVSSRLEEEKEIIALVDQFGQKIASRKFDEAYAMFQQPFRDRVKQAQFDLLWNYVGSWEPGKFSLTSIKSNERVEFEPNPATGEELARTMCILSFSGKPTDDRVEIYFHHSPGGKWTLANIPKFFPDAEGPKPK
jgi:hypothetical protein